MRSTMKPDLPTTPLTPERSESDTPSQAQTLALWFRLSAHGQATSPVNTLRISLVATLIVALIGVLDAATGIDLSIQILYLIPCGLLAWKASRASSLALSAISAGVWLMADAYSGHSYSHPVFAISNTLTLFFFLAASCIMFSAVSAALARETKNSRVDHLTGLWNARALHELAERELASSHRDASSVTVAYLDLDNFKHVNDTLGHLKADELLKVVACALRGALRGGDAVGRLGGDEFAILLPRTPRVAAEAVLARALSAVRAATLDAGFSVSFSLGSVSTEGLPASFETLLRLADHSMYEVKATGKAGFASMSLETALPRWQSRVGAETSSERVS